MDEAGMHAGTRADIVDADDYTVTVEDAAAQLGKSVDTVRRYIRQGKLLSLRVQGDRIIEYRLRPTDVQRMHAGTHAYAGTQVDMPTHVPMQARMHAYTSSSDTQLAPPGGQALTLYLDRLDALYQAQLTAKDALIDELRSRAERAERQLEAVQGGAQIPGPTSAPAPPPLVQPEPLPRPRTFGGKIAQAFARRWG
jgi:excisionase family DNA binding protein